MTLSGKNCLVTGANTGLGLAIAKKFAHLGANTLMLCRDKIQGENAVNEVKKEAPDAPVELYVCDLSSLESIQEFVEGFKGKYSFLG